jgi:hypothetical protein
MGPRCRAVLEYIFDHPRADVKEIAKAMGISANRIYQIKKHPKFMAFFPEMARRRFKAAVPELTSRALDLARQNENLGVAEKVVARVLDSQKVLESTPQTQINVFQTMSIDDLRRKIEGIKGTVGDVIEGEIADPQP